MHFDAVLFEQEFVDLFESYLGGLLDFYFLELGFLLDEELQ